jgi:hypothetical protein
VCGKIFWQGDRHHLCDDHASMVPAIGPLPGEWWLSPCLCQKIWPHTASSLPSPSLPWRDTISCFHLPALLAVVNVH